MIDKNNSTFLPEEYNYNENQSSLNNKIIRITNAIIRMRTIFEILIILKSLYSFINYNEAYYFFTLIVFSLLLLSDFTFIKKIDKLNEKIITLLTITLLLFTYIYITLIMIILNRNIFKNISFIPLETIKIISQKYNIEILLNVISFILHITSVFKLYKDTYKINKLLILPIILKLFLSLKLLRHYYDGRYFMLLVFMIIRIYISFDKEIKLKNNNYFYNIRIMIYSFIMFIYSIAYHATIIDSLNDLELIKL